MKKFIILWLGSSLSLFAQTDPTAVHLAGTETITGIKTFTNNIFFSDHLTRRLLMGAPSSPDTSGMLFPEGANLEILTGSNFGQIPFMVVGDYRSGGSSGDRYMTAVGADCGLYTNAYITIAGNGVRPPGLSDIGMLSISPDVPNDIVLYPFGPDSAGDRLILGYGIPDSNEIWNRVFEVSTEGTTTISNPYGIAGAVNWTRPQLILRDTNSTSNPSHIDMAFKSQQGESDIGTWNNSTSTFMNAAPWKTLPEIRIYPSNIQIIANLFETYGDMEVMGNFFVSSVGGGIYIKGGTNAKIGSGRLSSGTATIANGNVNSGSKIFVQNTNTGSLASVGSMTVIKQPGTGFLVRSTNPQDTSTFDYWIVDQY